MPGAVRAEAADLDVVAEQVGELRNLVLVPGEELLLVIEARAPREIAADFQILAEAMAHHVLREHAFGGIRVVRATGGVNVMIAGPPAELRGIDPALDLEGQFVRPRIDVHGALFRAPIRARGRTRWCNRHRAGGSCRHRRDKSAAEIRNRARAAWRSTDKSVARGRG